MTVLLDSCFEQNFYFEGLDIFLLGLSLGPDFNHLMLMLTFILI